MILRRQSLMQVAAALAIASLIASTSPHSVLVFLVASLCTATIGLCVLGLDSLRRISWAFLFYAGAAVALYLIQRTVLPEYLGFTGGRGIGADDTYFFVLSVPNPPLELTSLLSISRPHFFLFTHRYSDFLALVARPLHYGFGNVHPLDLLAINVAGMALLPSVVSMITRRVVRDERAANGAWWMVLLCPFLLANGVILVRDGLTAVALAIALLGAVERRFILMAIGVAGVSYLRLPHGALVIGSLWIIAVCAWSVAAERTAKSSWVGVLLLGAPVAVGLAALAVLPLVLANLDALAGLFFREGFLQGWISELAARDEGTSTFYVISQQPLVIRLPLAFAFYFGAPHLAVDELLGKPVFVPRDYLLALFSAMFVAYLVFFVRGIARAWVTRNGLLIGIAAAYLVDILLISQASMQIRHKVALMPMFYVLVAAGFPAAPGRVHALGLWAALCVGAFAICFNGYKLWMLTS